jgi:hypothetical protein
LHQRDQGRRNQQLIRDRVQQRSDGGDLFPSPREVAIQQIRARGRKKDRQRQPLIRYLHAAEVQRDVLLEQRRHQQGHEKDPEYRQRVGKIHPP